MIFSINFHLIISVCGVVQLDNLQNLSIHVQFVKETIVPNKCILFILYYFTLSAHIAYFKIPLKQLVNFPDSEKKRIVLIDKEGCTTSAVADYTCEIIIEDPDEYQAYKIRKSNIKAESAQGAEVIRQPLTILEKINTFVNPEKVELNADIVTAMNINRYSEPQMSLADIIPVEYVGIDVRNDSKDIIPNPAFKSPNFNASRVPTKRVNIQNLDEKLSKLIELEEKICNEEVEEEEIPEPPEEESHHRRHRRTSVNFKQIFYFLCIRVLLQKLQLQ